MQNAYRVQFIKDVEQIQTLYTRIVVALNIKDAITKAETAQAGNPVALSVELLGEDILV